MFQTLSDGKTAHEVPGTGAAEASWGKHVTTLVTIAQAMSAVLLTLVGIGFGHGGR
jgi:hypothetical protein